MDLRCYKLFHRTVGPMIYEVEGAKIPWFAAIVPEHINSSILSSTMTS